MTLRKELSDAMKDLPNDGTWLDSLMWRLKEKHPLVYDYMIASARLRVAELKEKSDAQKK